MRWAINSVTIKLFRIRLFKLHTYDLFGPKPSWQLKIERGWKVFWGETPFPAAILILAIFTIALVIWSYFLPDVLPSLQSEVAGTTIEIFFLLVVFAYFEFRRERFQTIQRQHEIIDDYKKWDDPEARVRIAGAIRRLNRLGISAVDLSGIQLSSFDFAKNGVRQLVGSKFYDGTWGVPFKDARIYLCSVKFYHVDCREVQFSPFDPFAFFRNSSLTRSAQLVDCSFISTNLTGAKFNGAALVWTSLPPASLYDEGEADGPVQVRFGPFDKANLQLTSFQGCKFHNADFRGAERIEDADFFEAEGLQDALFDNDEIKARVLALAAGHGGTDRASAS